MKERGCVFLWGMHGLRFITAGTILSLTLGGPTLAGDVSGESKVDRSAAQPFSVRAAPAGPDAIEVELTSVAYEALKGGPATRMMAFPISPSENITLELERFEVMTPETRFVEAGMFGQRQLPRPDVVLFRGRVAGEPQSHAFIALTGGGTGNGYVTLENGERYFLAPAASKTARGGGVLTVQRQTGQAGLPEFPEFCATLDVPGHTPVISAVERRQPLLGAPRVVNVAVDADQAYCALFDNPSDPQAYVAQVIGAVSDIYMRDLDVKLNLVFVRVWPDGGEPFASDNLAWFANYWLENEDMAGIHLVHLFSGRRQGGVAGVAYLSGPCSEWAFAISGYMLGSFPSPVVGSHLGNWDVMVVAHEMGHNMGTLHTHDGFTPPIDQCGGAGIHSRSTIMSYCHTTAGGLLNTDMRFHARVQDVIEAYVVGGGCLWADCNHNGIDDSEDISGGFSHDANLSGIPDECEDCNNNGILDDGDILRGAADINFNGIPDECERDCNGNSLPDEHEVANALAADENGNLVPDACDPDCDGNGVADHVEIANGTQEDIDRNTVPDNCQDCNDNGLTDWIDTGREHHVYVADLGDYVREFHADSGVGVQNLASGVVSNPVDLVFGPDNQLYVASMGTDSIVRIDVDTGLATDFVEPGSGGLATPSGLTFGPNENLFVSSWATSSVIEYDGETGELIGTFVSPGAGSLTGPYGLTFAPIGDELRLLVTSLDNSVLEYSGVDGSYVRLLVAPGSGGLSGPRALIYLPPGRLLVSSYYSNAIIEYDINGAFVGVFNDDYPCSGARGMKIGPNGNVFAACRTSARIYEYELASGRYIRWFIRGDTGLWMPTNLAFRPESVNDCNANAIPDECESLDDCNDNGVRDICDLASGASEDCNGNEVPDECDPEADCNSNGIQDICDIAAGTGVDCNGNEALDECDIAGGVSADCNTNAVPDECESPTDCNNNDIQDICDLADGTSKDCNDNSRPDECDMFDCGPPAGSWPETGDCCDPDGNGTPGCDCAACSTAVCEIEPSCCTQEWDSFCALLAWYTHECDCGAPWQDWSDDCDKNIVPDECEDDCNENGLNDSCDIADGTSRDCNANDIPDECEPDTDGDAVIDACDPCPHDNPDDYDGDGVCNSTDECPFDPHKFVAGHCGCGNPEDDDDGDSVVNCIDQCPGVDDNTFGPDCAGTIPTMSGWGLSIMALLLMTAAKLYGTRQIRSQAA